MGLHRDRPQLLGDLACVAVLVGTKYYACSQISEDGFRGILPINLTQLGPCLDHEYHPDVVATHQSDGLGNDRDSPKRGELIEQEHHLVDERRVVLGQLARLQRNRLLEEQREHRPETVQVLRQDPDVDADALGAKLAQIEVVRRCGPVQDRVQPQVQPRGEGLADAGGRDRRKVDHIAERPHALGRQRILSAAAPLDQPLPVGSEALVVRGHALPQDLADRSRESWRLEHVEPDAEEQRARRGGPERIDARRLLVEHVGDALQAVDAQRRVVGDIAQWIPAGRVAGFGERREQVDRMATSGAMAGGDRVVLVFRVHADQ